MDQRELSNRTRQSLAKRSDALLAAVGLDFAKNAVRTGHPASGRFFFAPHQVQSITETLKQRLPRQADRIIAQAEKICAHRFDLLGYEDVQYGEAIDWHRDPVHAKRAPLKPFHRVRYLDFHEVGDSKITWELNRHQHLVTLAKAYRLTGNQRYADEIFSQWKSWHAANPYPRGINWASSLEVAFRSLSWIWLYFLLDGTPTLPADFRRDWLRAQALNGRHLQRYLSTYFSPNTHLLGEGVGLFFLGTVCSELSAAERWKNLGWQIVVEEARRQVNPDGMHFEQSTYYHVYAIDFFLHSVILAAANGQTVPQELEETVEKMLNALAQLSAAGPPPSFGDDDGGRVFNPSRNRAEHLLDPLATGAVLFHRGDFKHRAGDLREETIWLLGVSGVEQWDQIEANPLLSASAAVKNSGLYALSTNAGQLIIDGGASTPQSYGHDHADALSVCLLAGGRALLIDPGTCEYVGPDNERNRFRGTAMHNTLTVDGLDQSEPDGPFSWKQHIHARAEQWIFGETLDLFVGSHDGYTRLPSPAVHRRHVVALKSGLFLVRDVVEGSGTHRLHLAWHLAPDLHVEADHVFRFKGSSQGLALLPVQTHGWAESIHKGNWSPAYGRQSAATVLNFETSAALPAEFVTLLIPLAEVGSVPGTLTRLEDTKSSSALSAYRYRDQEAQYDLFFSPQAQPWQFAEAASDAEFACLISKPNSLDAIFCNGTYLDFAGTRLLATTTKVERCERVADRKICSVAEALTHP